jgi:ribosome-associated protein
MTAHDEQPAGESIAPGVRVDAAALRFAFSRSSGPGGQNVNKRATRAELRIALADIPLDEPALRRLARLAGARLVGEEGEEELLLASDEHRTQARNKSACLERLRELLVEAMAVPKRRKKTRPTRGSVERRLQSKRERSEKKQRRRNPPAS